MPRLTEKQWEKLLDRLDQGESKAALSREFKVSTSAIRSHENKRKEQAAVDLAEIARQREMAAKAAAEGVSAGRTRDTRNDAGGIETSAVVSPAALSESDAEELARLRREVSDLQDELNQFRPQKVEWGWTRDAIERNFAEHMDDLVAQDIRQMNRTRMESGLAPLRPAEMEEVEPGWYDRIVNRIIDEAWAQLSASATDEGPDKIKLVMQDPNGNNGRGSLQQIVLEDGSDNGPAFRIARQESKGWKVVTPQPCARYNCWLPGDPQFKVGNLEFCGETHHFLYVSFLGVQRRGVTTSTSFDQPANRG